MTPKQFFEVAESLYCIGYQTAVASALGVSARSVRRWMAGSHPIPPYIPPKLLEAAKARSLEVDGTVVKLREILGR